MREVAGGAKPAEPTAEQQRDGPGDVRVEVGTQGAGPEAEEDEDALVRTAARVLRSDVLLCLRLWRGHAGRVHFYLLGVLQPPGSTTGDRHHVV